MKKLLTSILIFISVTSHSQKDSLLQVEADKYMDSLVKKTSINDLRLFLYKSTTAEKFDEFMQYYNLFIQTRGNEWLRKKQK